MLSFVILISFCVILVGLTERETVADGTSDEPKIDYIIINQSNQTLLPEDIAWLSVKVEPGISNGNVTWKSSNPSVVSVDPYGNNSLECKITALKAGTAIIEASYEGKTDSITVTVQQITITLGETDVVMIENDSHQLGVNISPSSASEYLTVTSSNSQIAQYFSSRIYSYGEGTAMLTFEIRGVKATCSVEVLGGWINASESINGNKDARVNINEKYGVSVFGNVSLTNGEYEGVLTATVLSEGMTNGSLTANAESYLEKCLKLIGEKASWAPINVDIDVGSATILSLGQNVMTLLNGANASLEAISDNIGLILDSKSVKGLGNSALSFSVKEASNSTSIENARVYDISLTSGSRNVTSVNGEATLMFPYAIVGDAASQKISAYSITSSGSPTAVETSYDAVNELVSVTLSSWGQIAVSTTGPGNDPTGTSMLSYVVLAVIIVLAVLCVILCYRYLRM